jgi:hypothetical protein
VEVWRVGVKGWFMVNRANFFFWFLPSPERRICVFFLDFF